MVTSKCFTVFIYELSLIFQSAVVLEIMRKAVVVLVSNTKAGITLDLLV